MINIKQRLLIYFNLFLVNKEKVFKVFISLLL